MLNTYFGETAVKNFWIECSQTLVCEIMFDLRSLGAVPDTLWETHTKVGLINNVTQAK